MIVVDLEMAGLDPSRNSIVSIGAVDFDVPTRQFYRECRIESGSEVDPAGLAVNGFTLEQVTDPAKPTSEESVAEFVDWVKASEERTLAGQNVSFDSSFLQVATVRAGLDWRWGYRNVDLHSVCWAHMISHGKSVPVKNGRTALSLDAILVYVGLPTEPKPHNALTGAKMEAEAFSRLMHARGLLDEFKEYPYPDAR